MTADDDRIVPKTWAERPSPIQPDGSVVLGAPGPEPMSLADAMALELDAEDQAWLDEQVAAFDPIKELGLGRDEPER